MPKVRQMSDEDTPEIPAEALRRFEMLRQADILEANGNGHATTAGNYEWSGEPRRHEWNAPLPAIGPAEQFGTVPIGRVPDEGPVRWLVRDLWLAEGVGIIGGEPKTFKSFAAAQLATCVASGKPMFGRYEVERGRVLVFNAEDRPAMTRDRIAKMCRALDVDLESLELSLVDVPALRLDDAAQMSRLAATVAAYKPTLLILDPLRDLHGLDENDARLMSALLVPLRVLQREHHCAVMVVHHMAKLTETQRRPGQRLRGSSAMHGWIDSGLYLTLKPDGNVLVEVEHRAAASPGKLSFTVEDAPRLDGDLLWLELDDEPDDGVKATGSDDAAETCVIAALQGVDGLLTGRQLRERCRQSAKRTADALKRLIAANTVVSEPMTGGYRTVPGYRLNT
jgi:hypothetical protein